MPITIQSLKDAQRARSQVPFCYICGKMIADQLVAGVQITEEDVIPRSILRAFDNRRPIDPSRWCLKLRACSLCNTKKNKDTDEFLGLWARVNAIPNQEVSTLDINLLGKQVVPAPEMGPTAVKMNKPFHLHAKDWIRGFHAGLYREYVPPDFKGLVFPPSSGGFNVPASGKGGPDDLLIEVNKNIRLYSSIRVAALAADNLRKADAIRMWSNECIYRAVWIPRGGKAECWWSLETPSLVRTPVSEIWQPTLWAGIYGAGRVPEGSECVDISEIAKWAEENEEITNPLFLPGNHFNFLDPMMLPQHVVQIIGPFKRM